MAISNNIVATRKLNQRNKARLRDTGDTEFGFIKGRLSHINKEEKGRLTAAGAYDISLRERVESDIAEKGAGTINPFTGMPEYHNLTGTNAVHGHDKDGNYVEGGTVDMRTYEQPEWVEDYYEQEAWEKEFTDVGDMNFQEFQDMDPATKERFLKGMDISEENLQYISEFKEEPFDFLKQEKSLAFRQASETGTLAKETAAGRKGLAETGLQAGYETSLSTLGRAAEGQYAKAMGGARSMAAQTGFATPGTVTEGFESQKAGLFGDYAAGTKAAGQELSLGMEQTAFDYTTSMKTADLGVKQARATAQLGFETSTYEEQERQMEKLWQQIQSTAARG